MVQRDILAESKFMLSQFRAICITGHRQSGKTTLAKMLFKGKPYVTFESPVVQNEAEKNVACFYEKI